MTPYMIDAKDNVEWVEYQIAKQFQKTTEEILQKSKSDFPAYMEECDQRMISWYFYKPPVPHNTELTTEQTEDQRFGEYIKQLLEEEAENNGKHNPSEE